MLLLNKAIVSCEIIVLSDKSIEVCITYYLTYDHFRRESEANKKWNYF